MKILNKLFILLLFHSATFSENEINLSINSDSIWRGITQNNGDPTIGADINFSLENGFFSREIKTKCFKHKFLHRPVRSENF